MHPITVERKCMNLPLRRTCGFIPRNSGHLRDEKARVCLMPSFQHALHIFRRTLAARARSRCRRCQSIVEGRKLVSKARQPKLLPAVLVSSVTIMTQNSHPNKKQKLRLKKKKYLDHFLIFWAAASYRCDVCHADPGGSCCRVPEADGRRRGLPLVLRHVPGLGLPAAAFLGGP